MSLGNLQACIREGLLFPRFVLRLFLIPSCMCECLFPCFIFRSINRFLKTYHRFRAIKFTFGDKRKSIIGYSNWIFFLINYTLSELIIIGFIANSQLTGEEVL